MDPNLQKIVQRLNHQEERWIPKIQHHFDNHGELRPGYGNLLFIQKILRYEEPEKAWWKKTTKAFFRRLKSYRPGGVTEAAQSVYMLMALMEWPIFKMAATGEEVLLHRVSVSSTSPDLIFRICQGFRNQITEVTVTVPIKEGPDQKATIRTLFERAGLVIPRELTSRRVPKKQKELLKKWQMPEGARVQAKGSLFSGCPDDASIDRHQRESLMSVIDPDPLIEVDGYAALDDATYDTRPDIFADLFTKLVKQRPQHPMRVYRKAIDEKTDEAMLKVLPLCRLRGVTLLGMNYRGWFDLNNVELAPYKSKSKALADVVLNPKLRKYAKSFIDNGMPSFVDLQENKGVGCNILLSGPPGVGKTLFSEAIAEGQRRLLLFVHSSSLGVDPEKLEQRLMAVIQRAKRLNAAILLDDADAYVADPGGNMHRSALLSTILSFLERHKTLVFITTNSPETLHPAVSSRCFTQIAIDYPTKEGARKIAGKLAALNRISFRDNVLKAIIDGSTKVSGRDIAQFIKACQVMSTGKQLTYETAKLCWDVSFADHNQ